MSRLVVFILMGVSSLAWAGTDVQLQLPGVYTLTGHSCGPSGTHIVPSTASWSADGNYFTVVASATAYCSTGGRGSHGAYYHGSATVTYNLFGSLVTYTQTAYVAPPVYPQGPQPPFVNPMNNQIEVTFYHYANLSDVLMLVMP
jgi:hypothetical protein